MTFDEALSALGIESSAEANVVRRAYLRGVKLHPPERDPEGFQRIRKAYEILSRVREDGSGSGSLTISAPAGLSSPNWSAPDAAPIEDTEALAMIDANAMLAGLDPGSEEWLENARKLIARHPRSAWVRWQLVSGLDESGNPKIAERAIIDALRAGHTDFLLPALHRCPSRMTHEEVVAAAKSLDPNTRNAGVRALLGGRKFKSAGRAVRAALDRASASSAPPPDPADVVRILLALRGLRENASASQLQKSFERWLSLQRSVDALGGGALRWTLYTELFAVRAELDPDLFAHLCGVLAQEEIDPTHQQLIDYRRRHRKEAEHAVGVFQSNSMNLDRIFSPVLTTERARAVADERVERRRSTSWPIGVFLFLAFSGLARLGSNSSRSIPPSSASERRARVQQSVTTLADLAAQGDDTNAAAAASRLETGLSQGDCVRSRLALQDLLDLDRGGRYSAITSQANLRVTDLCASQASPATESTRDE